ncbi:GNAT family N-acetyltransferase [Roseivivax sediminis]|nr:GNAT family N-acetyltransferase [Roseivivax sediminis]
MLDSTTTQQEADPAVAPTQMSVQVVEGHESFRRLKRDWQALEARDPEMTVFLSWAWLDRAFRDNPGRWRVFVVRSAAERGAAVAIFPVMQRARWNAAEGRLETGLVSAGRLILSELTGLLLAPEHEVDALRALARALGARPWADLTLLAETAPARARRFAAAFDAGVFETLEPAEAPATRPVLALPDSYESWLQTGPAPQFAQRIRRFQRRFLGSGARRVFVGSEDTFARDAGIVLTPAQATWTEAHGASMTERMVADGRAVLANAQTSRSLFVLTLWEGERPLGGLAHVLDHEMDRVHVVQGGAVPGEEAASIGVLLHAEAIRWAIEQGFAFYDFGRGAARYHHAFGARDRETPALTIRRRQGGEAATFDPSSLGDGLKALSGLLHKGQTEAATAAADQLVRLVR